MTNSSSSENQHLKLLIATYSTRERAVRYLARKGYSLANIESLLGRVGFPAKLAYENKN